MSEATISNLSPRHFDALEQLQKTVYPTLSAAELMRAQHFAAQYEVFPQGQFVALLNGEVVGQGSGFFINFDFDHPQHTFRQICDNFYFGNHDPAGAYYYGADISVHPDYQGRGIGRRIYDARKSLVRDYNRRGIVAGGLIPGYTNYRHEFTPSRYVDRVVMGDLVDKTLSFQLKMGFCVRDVIQGYIEDSSSENWATLIEWVNPDYVAL